MDLPRTRGGDRDCLRGNRKSAAHHLSRIQSLAHESLLQSHDKVMGGSRGCHKMCMPCVRVDSPAKERGLQEGFCMKDRESCTGLGSQNPRLSPKEGSESREHYRASRRRACSAKEARQAVRICVQRRRSDPYQPSILKHGVAQLINNLTSRTDCSSLRMPRFGNDCTAVSE